LAGIVTWAALVARKEVKAMNVKTNIKAGGVLTIPIG